VLLFVSTTHRMLLWLRPSGQTSQHRNSRPQHSISPPRHNKFFVGSQRHNGHCRFGRGNQSVTPPAFILRGVELHAQE